MAVEFLDLDIASTGTYRDSLMRLPRPEFACDARENSLPDPKNVWQGGTQPSMGMKQDETRNLPTFVGENIELLTKI